jgi:hypothetical protein
MENDCLSVDINIKIEQNPEGSVCNVPMKE